MKKPVADMARRCYAEALFAGTSGNLSLYDAETQIMAITPSSVDYTLMRDDDIVLMRLDGTVLHGHYKPSSEWRMHAAIYKNRPDLKAVVHTHSPYATGFAVVQKPVPLVLIEMVVFLGGGVPVATFALPGTDAVGASALDALGGDGCACLLANHGVVTAGDTLEQAHVRAVYVEDGAKIATLAAANGTIVTISEDQQRAMLDMLQGS